MFIEFPKTKYIVSRNDKKTNQKTLQIRLPECYIYLSQSFFFMIDGAWFLVVDWEKCVFLTFRLVSLGSFSSPHLGSFGILGFFHKLMAFASWLDICFGWRVLWLVHFCSGTHKRFEAIRLILPLAAQHVTGEITKVMMFTSIGGGEEGARSSLDATCLEWTRKS